MKQLPLSTSRINLPPWVGRKYWPLWGPGFPLETIAAWGFQKPGEWVGGKIIREPGAWLENI